MSRCIDKDKLIEDLDILLETRLKRNESKDVIAATISFIRMVAYYPTVDAGTNTVQKIVERLEDFADEDGRVYTSTVRKIAKVMMEDSYEKFK